MKNLTLGMIVILMSLLAAASEIDNILLIKDHSGASQILHFGLDPAATDTLDAGLGEKELPPFPPGGVFEARFVGDDIGLPQLGQGCYKDFRAGDVLFAGSQIHELKYQVGTGAEITIIWDLPENTTGLLLDLFGGVIVNREMKGNDSLLITNPGALNKLKMTIHYSGLPLTPELQAPVDGAAEIPPDLKLIWNASSGASTYNVQVSKSPDFSTMEIEQHDVVDTTFQLTNLEKSSTYYWRVSAENRNGASEWSDVWTFSTVVDTRILVGRKSRLNDFDLLQNYPNPFNSSTTIKYQLPTKAVVRIAIYDIKGDQVMILVAQRQPAGVHTVVWDGCNADGELVPSGAYFVRMVSQNFALTRKMLVLQ